MSERARRRPPTDRPIEEELGYVDPELAAAVAALTTDATPGLGDIGAMRDYIAGSLAFVPEPDDVDRIERRDLETPGADGAPAVPIRVYRPLEPGPRSLPALVWCHGGGFVFGGLAVADRRCAELCERLGAVVVSVDYRLAPEHPFPAGVEDADAAVCWAAAAADDLDIDRARLAVGGSSAGGTLAAAVTLMARDRGGPALALQVLVQPATDDRCATPSSRAIVDPRVLHREAQLEMWDHYLGPAGSRGPVSPYAAPARATDLSGLPPAIVTTAEHDPLADEGRRYAQRLRDDGVPTRVLDVPGTFHGFDELAPDAAVSLEATTALIEAIRAGL